MSTRHGVDVLARAIHKRLEESGSLDAFLKKASEWNLPFGRLVWTGFKPAQERISVTGQWLLFPPEDWIGEERIYGVSLPTGGSGVCGRVTRGQSLGFGPDDFEGFPDRDGLKAALLEGLIKLLHIVFEDEPPWLVPILEQGQEQVVRESEPDEHRVENRIKAVVYLVVNVICPICRAHLVFKNAGGAAVFEHKVGSGHCPNTGKLFEAPTMELVETPRRKS